jgi:soluble lytic murein transglycosylase
MRSKASVLTYRAGLGLVAALALSGAWAQAPQPSPPAARPEARSEPRAQTSAPGLDAAPIVEAREALRRRDAARLATLKAGTQASRHPLAMWVDYFELNHRLAQAQQGELDAFYSRWPATYVEDRLRNDWLLVLGQRRDWENFRKEFPRFRMNDDREVTCYALVSRHLAGETSA